MHFGRFSQYRFRTNLVHECGTHFYVLYLIILRAADGPALSLVSICVHYFQPLYYSGDPADAYLITADGPVFHVLSIVALVYASPTSKKKKK